jgi:tetratricopeptide (TPR) repeat protein
VYRALERFVEAVEVYRQACKISPLSAEAHYQLSRCHFQLERYEEAARYAGRAAELAPEDEVILSALGDTWAKAGEPYKAINAYKEALDQAPGAVDIMLRLGTTYLGMERYEPAEAILRQAVETAPDDTEPHLALAFCRLGQGAREEALAQYERVLAIERDNYKGHNGVGVVLMSMYLEAPGQGELARQALEHWHRSLELKNPQPQIQALVEKYSAFGESR